MDQPFDIIGYVFNADIYCSECMHDIVCEWSDTTPAAKHMNTETVLDQLAAYRLIDRDDETTFDSDDFPKIVFRSMIDFLTHCGRCGDFLNE